MALAGSYSMDVELFISEVQKYPEIWNSNNEDSRYPAKRLQAWTEIAKIFIEEFDELNSLERNDVYKKLHNKWRNIRDSFVRHKRLNLGSTKKGYIYAKNLYFLEDQYNKTGSQTGSQSGSDVEVIHEDTWPSDGDDEAKIKKMLFKSGIETKEDPLVEWTIDETPRERKRKKKTSKRERETQLDFVETNFPEASCSYSNEEEDRSFFNSLIPAIKDFDIDMKLEFRADVIRLIKTYRKHGSSNTFIESE